MKTLQLKLNRKSTFIWIALLAGITFAFMAVFPSMANESMQMLVDGKLDALPDALLAIVGFESIPDFTDIRVFYAYIMQYINIALAIFSLSLGLSTFLKEEEDGTIEFIYAQAISRKDFVLQKLQANIMLTIVVVLSLIFASSLSFIAFRPEGVDLVALIIETVPLFLSYFAIALIFLFLGTGLSFILKSGTSVSPVSMGIVFITYIVGLMSSMLDILEPLKHLSILHALFPSAIYDGNVNTMSLLLWVVFSLLVFYVGMLRFNRRDINV